MCFYDCIRYACECWKWGNMKSQCNKEYRMGESCGLKLVNETIWEKKACRLCEKIAIKNRRIEDMEHKIDRWRSEGRAGTLPATVERYYEDIGQLKSERRKLFADRDERRNKLR